MEGTGEMVRGESEVHVEIRVLRVLQGPKAHPEKWGLLARGVAALQGPKAHPESPGPLEPKDPLECQWRVRLARLVQAAKLDPQVGAFALGHGALSMRKLEPCPTL
jgi:hypothetical protein